MQLLDAARSRPYTDLLATLDELVTAEEPAQQNHPGAARARYEAMAAVIDAAQAIVPERVERARWRRPHPQGRRTG